MRSLYVWILFFSFFCKTFESASDFYQKQDFETALVLYAQKEHRVSKDWYMMGNAAFYQERYLQATVFWHQSAIMSDSFYAKNVIKNINQAREKLHFDPLKELPLLYPFGLNELALTFAYSLFLFSLVWLIVFLFIFYYRFRLPFVRLLFFITFIIITLFLIQKLSSMHQGYSGIVISNSPVSVRVGPSDGYHVINTIMPGDLVIIVSQNSDWYKIYYKNTFGWIASSNLMTVYSAAQSVISTGHLE
jgi:hypothetical protein